MLYVESQAEAYDDTMSVARLREIFAEVLDSRMAKELRRADGTTGPVTWEELSATEVLEEEKGRAVGVRPVYEVYYKEFRLPQAGALQVGAAKFRAAVLYNLGHLAKELAAYQPGLEWQLVAALVDPVRMERVSFRQSGYEPTPEEVSVRVAGQRLDPTVRLATPTRLSSVVTSEGVQIDWRWYVRTVWADVSGGADYSDPAGRDGGHSGLSRYAETRQLRHLPRGTRKNRERALDLVQRVGQLAIAPAAGVLSPGQRAAAQTMVDEGHNVALVAQMLDLSPEALAAELPKVEPLPKRRGRPAVNP